VAQVEETGAASVGRVRIEVALANYVRVLCVLHKKETLIVWVWVFVVCTIDKPFLL